MSDFDESEVYEFGVEEIRPSRENDEIYGAIDEKDMDQINLEASIANTGIKEPLIITLDFYILSGHRRYAAAKAAGLTTVPVRFVNFTRFGLSGAEYGRRLTQF